MLKMLENVGKYWNDVFCMVVVMVGGERKNMMARHLGIMCATHDLSKIVII